MHEPRREPPSISLLIPAFNEGMTIANVMERSLTVLQACTPDHEVIVLDDASTDDTFEIMTRVQRDHPSIRIERHTTNLGIAATFEDLYRLAGRDFVFLIAGDGEFPPEVLLECMPLLEMHDIVICRRTVEKRARYRRLISLCYRWLPRLLFGIDVVDAGSVKCMRREIVQTVPVRSRSVFVEAERLIRALKRGYRLAAVDIVQGGRQGGEAQGARLGTVLGAGADMIRCWFHLIVLRRPA